MTTYHLHGLIAAPFTPLNTDGSLNLAAIPGYYRFLKKNKITGAFICGSTGEGVSLTTMEKKDVAKAWADCTKGDNDFKVMMLTGGTSIADSIDIAEYARTTGLYAVSFTAPYYFKPADTKALADCCAAVAGAVPDMPFYYYHIPVLNGCNIAMINLLREIDGVIPNFAGIKYTHEDFMDFLSCLRFKNGKYDMLWGRDENMLASLVLGSKGAVGSTYNYAAPLYYEMIEAFGRNDLEKAQALQQKSIDMITLLGKYGGIATGKAYMKLVGIDCGGFRLPVRNMSDQDFRSFKEEVGALGFFDFCSVKP